MNYNVIVIGGGPGGYTAAIRAAQEGLKVALIEKDLLGGTCLNRGCIPTKALLHSTGKFSEFKASEVYGITADNISFDIRRAYQHKEDVVARLRNGLISLIKANKIEYIKGAGSFVDTHTIRTENGSIKGENIIIATGSLPSTIPVEGIEYAINSDDVLRNPVTEERIAVIGGGVIGVEFATILLDAGKSVHIIEAMDRLIPMMGADLSNALTMSLKKKKCRISTASRLKRIVKKDVYTIFYEDRTGEKELEVDKVIICTGRRANVEGLNLENVGIQTVKKTIKVDGNMHTGVGNIYAVGDVTGGIQLAHNAAAQGVTAVESILNKPHSVDLALVPSCIYTNPEIAAVGLSEEAACGRKIKTGKFIMGGNGRAVINGQISGFVKTIIDADSDIILGAELFMPNATDIVGELALAISSKIKKEQLLKVIHPHPTFLEAVYESLEDSDNKAIHLLPKIK